MKIVLIVCLCFTIRFVASEDVVSKINLQRLKFGLEPLIRLEDGEFQQIAQSLANAATKKIVERKQDPNLRNIYRFRKYDSKNEANSGEEASEKAFNVLEPTGTTPGELLKRFYHPNEAAIAVAYAETVPEKKTDEIRQWVVFFVLVDYSYKLIDYFNEGRSENKMTPLFSALEINQRVMEYAKQLAGVPDPNNPLLPGQMLLLYRFPDPTGLTSRTQMIDSILKRKDFPITGNDNSLISIACERGLDKSLTLIVMTEPAYNRGLAVLNEIRRGLGFPDFPPPEVGVIPETKQNKSATSTDETKQLKNDSANSSANGGDSSSASTPPGSVSNMTTLAEQLVKELKNKIIDYNPVIEKEEGIKKSDAMLRQGLLQAFQDDKKELLDSYKLTMVVTYVTLSDALSHDSAIFKAANDIKNKIKNQDQSSTVLLQSAKIAFGCSRFTTNRDGITGSTDSVVIMLGDGFYKKILDNFNEDRKMEGLEPLKFGIEAMLEAREKVLRQSKVHSSRENSTSSSAAKSALSTDQVRRRSWGLKRKSTDASKSALDLTSLQTPNATATYSNGPGIGSSQPVRISQQTKSGSIASLIRTSVDTSSNHFLSQNTPDLDNSLTRSTDKIQVEGDIPNIKPTISCAYVATADLDESLTLEDQISKAWTEVFQKRRQQLQNAEYIGLAFEYYVVVEKEKAIRRLAFAVGMKEKVQK